MKFIVPNAPGSSVDTIGRLLMAEMSKLLQQPAVADNKAGAAGALGAEAARTSPADGYTLLIGSSIAISTAPLLQKATKYDPLADFELISLVALLPNVLVCHPGLPVKSARDLVAYAKGKGPKGDQSNMASAGIGSASHLAGVAFQSAAGFTSVHVSYKGGSQGVASMVSGETDWVLTPQAFDLNGAVAAPSSPIEFRRFLERDIATNKRAIAVAGIQPDRAPTCACRVRRCLIAPPALKTSTRPSARWESTSARWVLAVRHQLKDDCH